MGSFPYTTSLSVARIPFPCWGTPSPGDINGMHTTRSDVEYGKEPNFLSPNTSRTIFSPSKFGGELGFFIFYFIKIPLPRLKSDFQVKKFPPQKKINKKIH